MKFLNLTSIQTVALIAFIFINSSICAQSVSLSKSFRLNSSGHLEMETSGGDIMIEGTNSDKVEISVMIKNNGNTITEDDPLFKKFNEYYDLEIEKIEDENKIVAYAKRIGKLNDWHFKLGVSFNVKVPYSTSNKIHVNSGNIKILDQSGTHKYTTSSGNIFLSNITGKSKIVTSGGNVEIDNCEGFSEIRISGGELFINRSKGNINAITSGGKVSLDEINGKVHLRNSGGHVAVSGHSNSINVVNNGGITANLTGLKEELYLNTTGGDIRVEVSGSPGMNLDLNAEELNIKLPDDFNGNQKNSYVLGSVNGGGIPVKVQATGGKIDFFLNK